MMHIIAMKKPLVVCCVLQILILAGAQAGSQPPVEGSESVVILRVQYAATVLNDEFVVIFNKGDVTVDLSRWVVYNSYYDTYRTLPLAQRTDPSAWKYVYRIPHGVLLKPRHWVRICSGHGQDDELYLYRNLDVQWLDDAGESVYLADNYSNLIHEYVPTALLPTIGPREPPLPGVLPSKKVYNIKICTINYDAPGNDVNNPNGEWVTICNTGHQDVDMSNWKLYDTAKNTFSFPLGFVLKMGQSVTIYTGRGIDTATELYWGKIYGAIWTNNRDCAYLEDDEGTMVDEYCW